jgi:hypothetical protein
MRGRFLRRGGFLGLLALVWTVAVACYGFVWFADPYELRFARGDEHLAAHPYLGSIVPRLIPVATHAGVDLALVGASTSLGYTTTMMRRAFPAARQPFNMSFPCADVDDMRLILPRLERTPSIKHVILSLDVTLMYECSPPGSPLDPRYYRHDWYDPVPDFSLEAMALSARELRTHVVDSPSWGPRLPDRVLGMTDGPSIAAFPDAVAALSHEIELARGAVIAGPEASCDDVPAIKTLVAPFVRRMAARGVIVDIITPPYSLAIYSKWTLSPDSFAAASPLAEIMALQRCALDQTAGEPNVRFHGLGNIPGIVGNLRLYRDVGHLADYATYQAILDRIAAGTNVITPAQWPQYEATLKREIAAYRLTEPGARRSPPKS